MARHEGVMMRVRKSLTALAGGALVASFALATSESASADTNNGEVIWPYVGGDDSVSVSSDNASLEATSMVEVMEAFGATGAQAQAAAAYDPARSSEVDEPNSLSGASPSRVEEGASDALNARVYVYDDGSLWLSLVQTDALVNADDTVIHFDSAVVDFVDITSRLVDEAPPGDFGAAAISGCSALPSSGGWTRRADCLVYDSSTPPVVSSSFRFDYSVKSGGGRIDAVGGATRWCSSLQPTSGDLYIYRKYNAGSSPAQAYNEVQCAHLGYLQIVSAYGSVWSNHNFNGWWN